MIIDGKNDNKLYSSFRFEKPGYHTIYYSFNSCQFSNIFENIEHLISISFSNFIFKCKIRLEKMFFGCKNLSYVDFSNLNFYI